MSPEYRPSFNKEARQGQGGGGKKEKKGQRKWEKQSATNLRQIRRSQEGLSNEPGNSRSARRREQFQQNPGEVATRRAIMVEGGLKKIPGNAADTKEIQKYLQ